MIPSRNPKLTVLVGPPGSGKSTLAKEYERQGFVRISQDEQGKQGHQELFRSAIYNSDDIVVDRMNFNKQQRANYLIEAKNAGYNTEIIVLHENYETCWNRMLKREDHPTIKNEENAKNALSTFFTKYERPEPGEADEIKFVYPERKKLKAVTSDIDGTIADCTHRQHFVRPPQNILLGPNDEMVDIFGLEVVELHRPLPKFKRNWKAFFEDMDKDEPIKSVIEIIKKFSTDYIIVYCSGRPEDYREKTQKWLIDNNMPAGPLYMRFKNDNRQDSIIKEILLDFEILTRFEIFFWLDDRQQVVDKIRSRNIKVLQCAKGDF